MRKGAAIPPAAAVRGPSASPWSASIDGRDRDYGGSDYTCRDPEGHLWTFGSYDPWATTGACSLTPRPQGEAVNYLR